jgi:predicted metalloprotease
MRFGGRRTSQNVESRNEGAGGLGGGGLGGAGASLLLGFVARRFGIVGVLVVLVIMFVVMGNPFGGGQQAVGPQQAQPGEQSVAQTCAEPTRRFLCQVLASTEDKWGELFTAAGQSYAPPRLVFYPGSVRTACGAGQSAMGPFYCPSDQRIYLDTSFFDELARRYGAPGDFAQAYVVAHEVGHHIQTITGTADSIRRAQSAVGRGEANALQVRMELQADCYAGVWAAQERGAMEPGDLQEGMTAAAAIGDDTLQRAGQGQIVPESFTHGTSAQRQEALMRGFNGNGPAACDAYMAGI